VNGAGAQRWAYLLGGEVLDHLEGLLNVGELGLESHLVLLQLHLQHFVVAVDE
jgi:hypothetical protein